MGLKDTLFFWRTKEDPELARRRRLQQQGRITEALITDAETDETGKVTHIFFHYTISNSDFDASQALLDEQLNHPERYTPGTTVSVRYDPHNPGNSFIP